MFTGIIEKIFKIKRIFKKGKVYTLEIETYGLSSDNIVPGESIAINGVCLTLKNNKNSIMSFDVVKETFNNTNLKYLKAGHIINFERSLKIGERLSGHFVLGHVDRTQKILYIDKTSNMFLDIAIPDGDRCYVVEKGSITIDGISLTINKIFKDGIRIYLIPHTIENTNLRYRNTGEMVNLEYDILGKFVKRSIYNSLYTKKGGERCIL